MKAQQRVASLLGFIVCMLASASRAQVVGGVTSTNAPPGVYIDAEGNVKVREMDATQDLTQMRVPRPGGGSCRKTGKVRLRLAAQVVCQRPSTA